MCECSGAHTDSKPRASSAWPSSTGVIEESVKNIAAPKSIFPSCWRVVADLSCEPPRSPRKGSPTRKGRRASVHRDNRRTASFDHDQTVDAFVLKDRVEF